MSEVQRLVMIVALVGVGAQPAWEGAGRVLAAQMTSGTSGRPSSGAATTVTDWSRVLALRSGQQIMITADGTGALPRRMVTADDASVVVLNDAVTTMPPEVVRVCEDLAANEPRALAATLSGRSLERSGVVLGPDGVVLSGSRIAGLDDILTRVDRNKVIEITAESPTDRGKKKTGMALIVAGFASMLVGAAFKNPEAGPGVGWYIGVPLVVAGIAVRHESGPHGLIYRRAGHPFSGS